MKVFLITDLEDNFVAILSNKEDIENIEKIGDIWEFNVTTVNFGDVE